MTQIGRYEIVRETGQTPLGTIYEAIDSATRRTVAIQATADPSEVSFNSSRAQAAVQESSESLSRLNHLNIVNLLAVERADGKLFLVMEHAAARTLAEQVAENRMSPSELLKLLKSAAAALDYAHANGVFHPGLTPAHLLVNAQGTLKIAGFEVPGFEAFLDSAGDAELHELQDSVPYRAPEFLCGEATDGRADQFALAAIAYELVTGRRLFQFSSPIETMAAIIGGKRPDLNVVEARVSPAFRRVLERALAPQANDRYPSCSRMTEDMELAVARKAPNPTVVRNTPARNVDTAGPLPIRQTPGPRAINSKLEDYNQTNRRRIRWMIAATILVSIVMVALIVGQMRQGPPPPHSDPKAEVTPKPQATPRSNPQPELNPPANPGTPTVSTQPTKPKTPTLPKKRKTQWESPFGDDPPK